MRLRQRTLRQRRHAHSRKWWSALATFACGGYPDIDALFKQQDVETDRSKREALLHQIQQLMHERVMFAPIWLYYLAERHRATGGGAGADVDQPLPLVRAPGRRAPEAGMSRDGSRCEVRITELWG